MTRAAPTPAARTRRRVALAVSIALHLIALALVGALDRRSLEARPGESTREVVTIGHLRIEPRRPLRRVPVPPKPVPRVVARTLVAPKIVVPRPAVLRAVPAHPAPAPRAAAHPAARLAAAPAKRAHAASARTKRTVPAPKAVALAPRASVATSANPRLTDARIAAIEKSLGDAIASDRRAHDPLAVAAAAPPETVRHGLDATGMTTGDRNHHGLCSPIKDWTEAGFDYYYLECNVRFSDGTFQRQSVPWPVRFKPDADPFAGTAPGGEPLQGPMPGWHLAAGAYISPELRAYALDHGGSI